MSKEGESDELKEDVKWWIIEEERIGNGISESTNKWVRKEK